MKNEGIILYWLFNEEHQRKVREDVSSLVREVLCIKPNPQHYKESVFPFSGRKCYKIASKVINVLSKENDLIYDPFIGSGTFVLASQYEKRRMVASDLDPYLKVMHSSLYNGVNIGRLKLAFESLKALVEPEMKEIYKTTCTCGTSKTMKALYFDFDSQEYINPTHHERINPIKNNLVFTDACTTCRAKKKQFDSNDLVLLQNLVENYDVSDFPNNELIPNSRINITPGRSTNYSFFFLHRQKIAVLKLWNAISNLSDGKEKNILTFVFLANLNLAKITDYRTQSQDIFYVPRVKNKEQNIWFQYSNKYKEFLKCIEEISRKTGRTPDNPINIIGTIDEVFSTTSSGVYFKFGDYREIGSDLDNQVDLILTDPPYTDQVPYLERSQLFYPWIDYSLNSDILDKEIVMSDAPSRTNKNRKQYWKDIDGFFERSSRQLKEHKYMVLYFKPSGTRWLEDLNYFKLFARKHGLEPIQTFDVSKEDPSKRKVSSATWSWAKDLLLVYVKLKPEERYWFFEDENMDKLIYKIARDLTVEKDEFTLREFQQKLYEELRERQILGAVGCDREINRTLKRYCIVQSSKYRINEEIVPPFTELVRQIDIELRIFDYTPWLVEKLLAENEEGFTYPDFLLELSLYLDNGEKEVIKILERAGSDSKIRRELSAYVYEKEEKLVQKPPIDISTLFLEKGRQNLNSLSGEQFEELIKVYLEKVGFERVSITARTDDRGVDIIALKNGEKYVIQCKRWERNPVSARPVQRLDSYRRSRGVQHAWVITTSYFTPSAKDEARLTDTHLIDGIEIRRELEKVFPGRYF